MMQHHDIADTDRPGGSAIAWVARVLMMTCGLVIGLVVLSDPRVTGMVLDAVLGSGAGDEVVARQDSSAAFPALTRAAPVVEAALGTTDPLQDRVRPPVSVLPESRVNVIRLTD